MSEQLSEYETRSKRLQDLKAAGVIPYANKYDKKNHISELILIGSSGKVSDGDLLLKEGAGQTYSTAGRMMSFRTMGKLSFATIRDHSADIQICFVKGLCTLHTGRETVESIHIDGHDRTAYKFAEKFLDIGDFIGVKGELFVTKHGELTLFIDEFQLLSKALRPLGDKWNGIQDEEKIYRKRYLDMTMNRESFKRMKLRSTFVKTLREFYRSYDFMELDTPILGNSASGAAATPFVTRHEDFDMDMYLRIAPEIALKIATVGGLERVFEIGKNFRNEGSSPSHHQEFLVAEHYSAYRNFEDNITFTENMFDYLFDKIPELSRKVMIADKEGKEREVDFTTPWQRIDYTQQIEDDSGVDVSKFGPEDADSLRQVIKSKGHVWEGIDIQTTATMIDYLYKKVTRPKIIGPAFIYNYPKTMQPLARQSDQDANIVEQFQVVVNGWEIIKAYSELVDPVIQQENFDEQAGAVEAGDAEATKGDDEFVLSMEHGMPPQSGRGMGIGRVLALLTKQSNIRDIIMFPMMKPTGGSESQILDDSTCVNTTTTDTNDESNPLISSNSMSQSQGAENTDWSFSDYPTIEQAEAHADKHLTSTRTHCQQVGEVMRSFAKKLELSEDEQKRRYMTGLLHDLDWDACGKDGTLHMGELFGTMMAEIDAPEILINDIRSHYTEKTGIPVDTMIRKYLISIDELSGFLYAYSLMRPTNFEGMAWKGINKRLKDKKFAGGVDRDHVRYCEKYLDIPVNEFALEVSQALSEIE